MIRNLEVPRFSLFPVRGQTEVDWGVGLCPQLPGPLAWGTGAGDDLHGIPLQTAVALSPLPESWGAQTRSRAPGRGR